MKIRLLAGILLMLATTMTPAQTTNLTGLLQQGLMEDSHTSLLASCREASMERRQRTRKSMRITSPAPRLDSL